MKNGSPSVFQRDSCIGAWQHWEMMGRCVSLTGKDVDSAFVGSFSHGSS